MPIRPNTSESVLTPEFARSLVLRIAASWIPSVLLEDLAQEALLRGVRAFQRDRVDHPYAFFAKIVRDTVSDHWRRERVWLPLEDIDPRKHNHVLQLEDRIDLERRVEQLREALRLLAPRERQSSICIMERDSRSPSCLRCRANPFQP